MIEVFCQYCWEKAILITGKELHPTKPDLSDTYFWRCNPCNAHVGVHKSSKNFEPLGELANGKLRWNRRMAHAAFDPIWKNGYLTRGQAYNYLADKMRMFSEECHIALFTEEQCKKVIDICETFFQKHGCDSIVPIEQRKIDEPSKNV